MNKIGKFRNLQTLLCISHLTDFFSNVKNVVFITFYALISNFTEKWFNWHLKVKMNFRYCPTALCIEQISVSNLLLLWWTYWGQIEFRAFYGLRGFCFCLTNVSKNSIEILKAQHSRHVHTNCLSKVIPNKNNWKNNFVVFLVKFILYLISYLILISRMKIGSIHKRRHHSRGRGVRQK